MNSTRQQQLLANIKRIISTQLMELNHELLHGAVVTDVLLSNDGRECRVYVDAPEETITRLNTEFKSEIQRNFMKQYVRKIVPRLQFLKDRGEVEALEELLEKTEKDEE